MDDAAQWSRLALLADPVRRSVFELLAADIELTREQVADQAGISPSLAAHHLGKLTEAELIEKLPGIARGREGRPPAHYRRARLPQLPGRRPELLTDLLVVGRPDMDAVCAASRRHGSAITPKQGTTRTRARRAMAALGFTPRSHKGGIDSSSCPFVARDLAVPETACDVALSLADGIAAELSGVQVERVVGGACCVRLLVGAPGKQVQ
ncbi:MAG: transcriptional regulator [Frankiales bacterium]|nr:transcriptional regulator [Frankiales bacterium]